MQCRNCGAQIADKAIVCYRCGHGTTDPVRRAAQVKARRSPIPPLIAALVILLAAAFAQYTSQTAADPEQWQQAAMVLAGSAVIVAVLGVLRSRR